MGNKEHLLILHFESGDEIHLWLLEMKHCNTVTEKMEQAFNTRTTKDCNELTAYIINNHIEKKIYQTYVVEPYFETENVNIKKVIHIPELGC